MFIFSQKSRKLHGPVGRIFCSVFFAMMIVFTGTNAVALPSGYTELEYIESTGTQYIKSTTPTSNVTKVELVAEITSTADTQWLFGRFVADSALSIEYATSRKKFACDIGSSNSRLYYDGSLPGKHTFIMDVTNRTFTVDGVRSGPTGVSGVIPSDIYALVGGNYRGWIGSYAKYYSVAVWENGTLAYDLVPARRNSDSMVGMYDFVSGTFRTNEGSGEFTAGPAVRVKIASKTYSTNQFTPIKTQMVQIVTDVNTIVNTTITQANGIETLATTKQDRPATNCPAGRKCLLVKTPSGDDAWYPIAE